jgi:hypothetical protein
MPVYTIKNTKKRCVISIDRSKINAAAIAGVLDSLRCEELIQKAGFSPGVVNFGREIKRDWWKRNKGRYLKGRR